MEKMVHIFLMGKQYEVPSNLTIMKAMEYAGYQLIRGCGCRNGFCGACATIYRIKGNRELKVCLACQTKVEDNMYVATLPFFPLIKQVYDIEKISPTQQIMMQLYPEIYACIGCNACTKSCTCMYSDFTLMASGNPRTSQLERFRQRFMHKLVYFPANNDGIYGCVGCGRCLSKCPISMNIVKVAKSLEGEL